MGKKIRMESPPKLNVIAVDLFCGAGGLSLGLKRAGITVALGIDADPNSRYPFENGVRSSFVVEDVSNVDAVSRLIEEAWSNADVRVLAGCAPCQLSVVI